jgi:glyoxylase-like metal-dependent hydrolase (beta-lactamase superfamily II)
MNRAQEVVPIDLGFVRAFLVRCGRWLLVDSGVRGSEERIARAVTRAGITPERDLALIVLTHGHTDHMGGAPTLRDQWRVPIAMHRLDADAAQRGLDSPLRPTGVAGRLIVLASRAAAGRTPSGFGPDLLIDDETSLRCLGLEARILCTPGHTAGSISVLTDAGDALIGDLVIGHTFRRGRPWLPYLADDVERLRQSVQELLAPSPRSVHSAHGRPFSVDDLARWIA